jgi:predicted acyltransferase
MMATPITTNIKPITLEAPARLQSLDALRGFVMFWIIGGDALTRSLAKAIPHEPFVTIAGQMEHPLWDGFAFYDVIFPTFLFAAGAALPFSVLRRVGEGKTTRGREILRGARRTLMLVFFGMAVGGILHGNWGPHMSNVRFGSVLGRIGIAWFLAMVISLYFGSRGRVVWFVGIVLGYWAAMKLIPVPGHGAGDLSQGANLCDFIDQHLMPGRLYRVNHDPEGLFSTIPAIATALLGVLAGDFLRSSRKSLTIQSIILIAAGVLSLGIAFLWNFILPVNKNLWSSSFVFAAGGISLLLFGFLHWLMEARRWTAPAFFFTVIGMNAIAIYLATEGFVSFAYTAHAIFGGAVNAVTVSADAWRAVLNVVAVIAVEWFCLWLLWRKRIFIRV